MNLSRLIDLASLAFQEYTVPMETHTAALDAKLAKARTEASYCQHIDDEGRGEVTGSKRRSHAAARRCRKRAELAYLSGDDDAGRGWLENAKYFEGLALEAARRCA